MHTFIYDGKIESSKEYKILLSLSHQFVQVLKYNKDIDTKKKKRITIDVSRSSSRESGKTQQKLFI